LFSLHDYLTQHAKAEDVPPSVAENAAVLLSKVRALLDDPDCPSPDAGLRSGYRPPDFNAGVKGAAPNSKHMTGHAVDINDNDEALDNWLTDAILAQYELYREAPSATPGWLHCQDLPPNSGKRTFIP
jgi:hypothetical protein